MMRRALVPLLTTLALSTALELPDFGAGWQQVIANLGLQDNNVTASGCQAACAEIHNSFPIPDALPSTKDYWKEQSFYWSAQQGSLKPACFALPSTAEDVSKIILLAQQNQCKFAVKSGGHAAFEGGSNIQGGITIDLQRMNELTVSEDKTVTRVGPGNRWIDVYKYLSPMHLSVVGGRDSEIGVGGLTLGGGISWWSARYGWAADNVRNYEVVVASGEILDVNHDSYPDLYWALRGGGNNFGVVTRLDLETFPQGDMWGGSIMGGPDSIAPTIDAFYHFALNAGQDVDAGTYSAFCYYPEHKIYITSTAAVHARPVENPTIFENYTNNITPMHKTTAVRDLVSMSDELSSASPNGLRNSYRTVTFKVAKEMIQAVVDNYMREVEPVKEVEGIITCAVVQPMTPGTITNFKKNGGNCLGVDDSEGPLFNVNYNAMWKNIEDDEKVHAYMKRTQKADEAKAKELGLDHPYLYMNYAAGDQDVIGGYGEENRAKLREISKKYDPDQVFQILQPGYFKL